MIVAGVGSGYLAQSFGYAAPFAAAGVLLILALATLRGVRTPTPSTEGTRTEEG